MKAFDGVDIRSWRLSHLNSALDGGELSASLRGRFYLRGRNSRYPLGRRLDGAHIRSRHHRERKSLCFFWESNSEVPVVQPLGVSNMIGIKTYETGPMEFENAQYQWRLFIIGLLVSVPTSFESFRKLVVCWDSSVCIASRLRVERPRNMGSIPCRDKKQRLNRLWGPPSLPTPTALRLGGKAVRCEAHLSLPSSAEVKNLLLLLHMSLWLGA
jgi:hypothetical protein